MSVKINIEDQVKCLQKEFGAVIKLVKNLKITVEALEKKLEVMELEFEAKIKSFENRIIELSHYLKEKETAIKCLGSKVSEL